MSVVDIKDPPEFDTLEVLAAAVAIYEHNNGYVKTNEFISLDEDLQAKKYANREILRHQFMVDYYSGATERPPLVPVKDKHRISAQEIRDYSKKEIFKLLNNDHGYATDLYSIINSEYANPSHFGYIASAPFYFDNGKKRDFYTDKIKNIQSQHVGIIGTKVHLEDFEIIRNSKSNNYPGWIVLGICEGNLFMFFTKNEQFGKFNIGQKISIEGTVKDHVMEQNTTPMTKLNRVYERIRPSSILNTVKVTSVSGLDDIFS